MPDRTRTATVAGDGTAIIRVQPYGALPWSIMQVSTELASAPIGATCAIRKYTSGSAVGFLVTPMVATGDVAAGDPPVQLLPEDTLTIEWAGCTPGSLAKALVTYDVGGR